MNDIDKSDIQKEIKKAEKRGKRKGVLGRIRSFFIGILCGIVILTGVSAYMHGKNFIESFKYFIQQEEPVENYDMTLENYGILGYKVSDFSEAVLGDEKQLRKLEVYSREVSDVVTLTKAGLGKIKAFSKYQYITYNGMATYTVDLSKLNQDSFSLNESEKILTITIPEPVLEPINIPRENIEFGDVEKNSIFAFGDIKFTPEEQVEVETGAKERMIMKLEEENAIANAENSAEHAIWEMFQPVVSGVSSEYALKINFAK